MANATASLRTGCAAFFLAFAFLLAACGDPNPAPVTENKGASPAHTEQHLLTRSISAGPVRFSASAPNHKYVEGSFKVTGAGVGAIPSYGLGGACLIADLNRFNKPYAKKNSAGKKRPCANNSDCQRGLPADWSGYCADQEEGSAEKICWVRPGPDTMLCEKSIFYEPPKVWPLDTDNDTRAFDITMPYHWAGQLDPGNNQVMRSFEKGFPGRIRWRVVACLNGTEPVLNPNPPPEKIPACGAPEAGPPNRLEVFGTPVWTPQPENFGLSHPDSVPVKPNP